MFKFEKTGTGRPQGSEFDGNFNLVEDEESEDFAFDFNRQLDIQSRTADELFDGGKIKLLDQPPETHEHSNVMCVAVNRRDDALLEGNDGRQGRERVYYSSSSRRQKLSRSLSPVRAPTKVSELDHNEKCCSKLISSLSSSSNSASWKYDKLKKIRSQNEDVIKNSSFRSTHTACVSMSHKKKKVPADEWQHYKSGVVLEDRVEQWRYDLYCRLKISLEAGMVDLEELLEICSGSLKVLTGEIMAASDRMFVLVDVRRKIDCTGLIIAWDNSTSKATIITSAKLARLPRDEIVVPLPNGKILLAEEHYVDYYHNIMTLKFSSDVQLKHVELSSSPPEELEGTQAVALRRDFYNCNLSETSGIIHKDYPYFGCDQLISSTCAGYKTALQMLELDCYPIHLLLRFVSFEIMFLSYMRINSSFEYKVNKRTNC
ncbi:hypothetical protein POM88_002192 [Heracleum sosnowskyi]|uniref:Uncharacterized protein n=1 Tax=Heracleum sosnowskyi TaxID=360622 RepID=A0AAD8NB24_9APIA|nr:hypothetical protein POM88_002192 [Heracleum sosnowskyi]